MRKRLSEILEKRVLLLDGAYGTEFIKHRPDIGEKPAEILNLEDPGLVEMVHRSYVDAGADAILTNTFGAVPSKLSQYGLGDRMEEIVAAAVRIAKKASSGRTFVFGDIGPTGVLPRPMGNGTFDFYYRNFKEVAEVLIREGVDAIILETFPDIMELKAAVIAVRDTSEDVFLIAHLTFDINGRTLTGTDPTNFAITIGELDVDALGVNCTLGPEDMLAIFQELARHTDKFLVVEPNAGYPTLVNGKLFYPETPERFAGFVDSFWEAGANIIGGCCGTRPAHIRAMRRALGIRAPVPRSIRQPFAATSPSKIVVFSGFVPVGERINPFGRKKLGEAIAKKDFDFVEVEARKQAEKGALILDVNFGNEEQLDIDFATRVISELPYRVGVPLSADVQSPDLAKRLIRAYPGRAILNSSRAVPRELGEKASIVKKLGGILVVLAMGDSLPESFEDRKRAIDFAIEALKDMGLDPRERAIIDPVVLPAGVSQKGALDALKAIEYAKSLGLKTLVGLSNISYGLPERSSYNTAFLVMCLAKGLDSAILNPLDETLMKVARCTLVLLGREKPSLRKPKVEDEIADGLLSGDREKVIAKVRELIAEKGPLEVAERYLKPAMERVGDLYDAGEIFLPQLIMAAQVAREAFRIVEEALPCSEGRSKFVIATVKGDIHDIGKNIVSAVVKSSGFEVIDLGKDVDAPRIVEAVKAYRPIAVGLSAMMTTTAPRIKEVVEALKREGINVPVIAGGASLSEKLAKELGASFFAKGATDVVKFLKSLEKEGEK